MDLTSLVHAYFGKITNNSRSTTVTLSDTVKADKLQVETYLYFVLIIWPRDMFAGMEAVKPQKLMASIRLPKDKGGFNLYSNELLYAALAI